MGKIDSQECQPDGEIASTGNIQQIGIVFFWNREDLDIFKLINNNLDRINVESISQKNPNLVDINTRQSLIHPMRKSDVSLPKKQLKLSHYHRKCLRKMLRQF